MILHKLVSDAVAGKYLPFALAKLKALNAIFGDQGYFSRRWEIEGVSIDVQQSPPAQFVRLSGGYKVAYEFFTSAHIDQTLATPGLPAGSWVAGSATRATFPSNGKVEARPLYSSELSPQSTDAWPHIAPTDADSKQGWATKYSGLHTYPSWQRQKFTEYAWYPHNGTDALVACTMANAGGLGNRAGFYSPYNSANYVPPLLFAGDHFLDLPPALYTKSGVTQGAPYFPSDPLQFWRRAVVQEVTIKGTDQKKKFWISTDNLGQFQIYAVSDQYLGGLWVLPQHYKTYTPPYPDWVSLPAMDDPRKLDADWLWKFNKDATKCVAIPFHAEDSEFYKYVIYDPTGWPNNLPYTYPAYQATMLPEDVARMGAPQFMRPAREDTPGLVEFGITITAHSADDMDFDVEFKLLRNSYFGAGGPFYLDAAYTYPDRAGTGIPEDTLVTLGIDCQVPAGQYTAEVKNETDTVLYRDKVEQMAAWFVLHRYDNAGAPTEFFRVETFSGISMQFPTVAGARALGGHARHATQNGGVIGVAGFRNPGYPAAAFPFATNGEFFVTADHPAEGELFSAMGPVATAPYQPPVSAHLDAIDLPSLSLFYTYADHATGRYTVKLIAFNKEIAVVPDIQWDPQPVTPNPPVGERVPSPRPYFYVRDINLLTSLMSAFSAHPAGHWSWHVGMRNAAWYSRFPWMYDYDDWVMVCVGKAKWKRYRHKDLFNAAFKVDPPRAYTWYPPMSSLAQHEYGGFRTGAFWVTFR